MDNGRIMYYNFSGDVNDSISEFDGTNFGAKLTTDRFGNISSAYSFDGVNDYIEIANNSLINFEHEDDFSISLWVYIPLIQNNIGSGANDILAKWNAFNNTGYPYAIRYLNESASNKNKFATLRYDNETCANNPVNISPCPIEKNNWEAHNLSSGLYYYNISIYNCRDNIKGWIHVLK